MRVLTVEQTKLVEKLANENGISYMQLMENAGSYCARLIRKNFDVTNKKNVLIVCGKGRNGGDGFVIARKLFENGYKVKVMMAMGLSTDGLSSEMFSRVRTLGIPVVYYEDKNDSKQFFDEADIIVDCIFGIGFHGKTNEICASLFKRINSSSATVVSIDIPSGLEGDNNKVNSDSVNADVTIAVLVLKPVHILTPSKERCGNVLLAPINIPEKCFDEIPVTLFTMNEAEIKKIFKPRDSQSHKGTYGTVLVIGGSYEMPNAVYFASRGAVNSGAGLVKIAFPAVAYNAIAPKTYEQTLVPLESNKNGRISVNSIKRIEKELKKCSCVVLGCGMGVDDDTRAVTEYVIKNSTVPIILDADGINCLKNNIDIIDEAKASVILTPHPKELSRLLNVTVEGVQENRIRVTRAFTKAHKSVLVLKGASTIVGSTEYDDVYVNLTGNPGMATGGSGDVLSGIIGSFVAQGVDPFKSAVAGAFVHGMAGDEVSEKYSMMGNTPSLILNELPVILKKFE